ncbi:DNA segregation ATPase FtsK/SpoIIIE [Arthrobacter sp. cf158]|uniref:FtsK/SpoIIIE domain-containing protein n=1 Tax=Arthrobacter sp. cf158 TaxID=1761744 RepID=UPI000896AC82|nr:FtsK/SpoIIIE domain-containing protein [Arthrobacter sp. cf158]SDW85972.1 DNA segregation ATPase FtsK/SpoIIIE [Arthrobacter sp. cf158]
MALPTLAYWIKRLTPEGYAAAVGQGLAGTVRGVEAHLTKVARSLDVCTVAISSIVDEREAIVDAFASRWNVAVPSMQQIAMAHPPTDLVERLRTGRQPWFQSGKDGQRQRESMWVSQRLFELEKSLVTELQAFANTWSRSRPAQVQSPATQPPALLPGIADRPNGLDRVNPGEGPLVLQIGEAVWSLDVGVPHLSGMTSSGLTSQIVAALPPAKSFPVLIDFVRDGGFATDHRSTVESAVVRLLALLPAAQLKVRLFDPVRVGASLKFLSDLGDLTRSAVADVRVVAADLEPLLDDLTRHVALVTQQYLGSRHGSLAEYNRAAGEVAEAYHLLVLMDFPAGRVDDEVLRKLETLVRAGPTCGVFTLILSAEPGRYSFGLPVLQNAVWVSSDQMVRGMRGALPALGSQSGQVTIDGIRSKDWRRYLSLRPKVLWSGSAWSSSAAPEVKRLVVRLDRDVRGAKPRSITPAAAAKRLQSMPGRGRDANPDDPSTWWRKRAIHGVEANVGVTGDRDVATVVLESAGSEPGLIIGGQPGTGKSVLLHALICDLARNYSPQDLELYLLDPKQGVEFTVYATGKLPHAKVITVKAPPASTILVLEDLMDQIAARGELFRNTRTASGANPDKLDDYLAAPGARPIPRIVAVIDEFQALLNTGDDETSMRAAGLLDRTIREGRAFGIHLVLATQSLQGISHLPSAVTNMIGSKVVLRVSEDDSRIFLGPQDLDAARLGKGSGKAILKRPGIRKREIQVTNETKDSAHTTVKSLAAKVRNTQRPTVLDFSRMRPPTRLSSKADSNVGLQLLVARGMGVTESVNARLPVNDDGHLLVVAGPGRGTTPGPNLGILSAMLATCVVARVPFDVVDFGDMQTGFDIALGQIQRTVSGPQRRFARRNLFELYLDEALTLARQGGPKASTRKVLFLVNAHRNRELVDGGDIAYKLSELLSVAATGRVHVVLHSDTGTAASRILSNADLLPQFGARLFTRLDSDSSYQLLGSNEAERLVGDELLLWEQTGEKTKAVPFAPFDAKTWARIAR